MTALVVHELTGCAPAPLAHYLKALGVLRLVAEQKDPGARGFWKDERFCLLTALDREDLERFFLHEYAPTPFVSPWNKGSGFFASGDALCAIEASTAPRFAAFRMGIEAGRRPLSELAAADAAVRALKDRTKSKKGMTASEKAAAKALKDDAGYKVELSAANRHFAALKADLFSPCDLSFRGPHRAWMDAAVVLQGTGKPSFPSLLGTGGNDGRVDFTNNAMQRILDLFAVDADGGPLGTAASALRGALWGCPSRDLAPGAVGQFFPGSAGGANATTGPDGASAVNPWDFVLMLEGSILFSARATRRLDPTASSQASAPFAMRSHAIGHGSSGAESAERGEQWMPLWETPATLGDVRALVGEARLQVGRGVAHRPIDAARAIARLGAARGVGRFTRFGFLQRNGQSNLAVPIGEIDVVARPEARLVDDIAPWLDRLQRLARDKHAPARLVQAERRLGDAVFASLTHDGEPGRWQAVLVAAAAVEAVLASGTGITAGAIPPLGPGWVEASNDGGAAFRLAIALGSAAASYESGRRACDPVRHHWLPLEGGGRRLRVKEKRLVLDPRVVMTGRDAPADFAAIVERRLVEAAQRGQRRLPLVAAPGFDARLDDLAALLAGKVDLERVSALARAFMAVRWDRVRQRGVESATERGAYPSEAWMALRLALLPWPLGKDREIPAEDAIVRRLRAGDGAAAVELALRRLRASGLRPPLRCAAADRATAWLWAAALAFPISPRTAHEMSRWFEPSNAKERR